MQIVQQSTNDGDAPERTSAETDEVFLGAPFEGAPFPDPGSAAVDSNLPSAEPWAENASPLTGAPLEGEPFAGEPFEGPALGPDETATVGYHVDAAPEMPRPRAQAAVSLERRAFRVIAGLAFFALVAAVAANAAWSPAGTKLRNQVAGAEAAVAGEAAPVKLEKPAVSLLPADILAYETIAHHPVPGQGDLAGEAIYATLNMNLEAMVPVGVYARSEGFGSDEEAKARLQEVMAPYQTKPEEFLAGGVTPVRSGYSADLGAYVVGWTKGPYTIFVKTHFKDKIPADKRDFLRLQSKPAVEAIELFQRTGQEGLNIDSSRQ